jgi:hypothetical protein
MDIKLIERTINELENSETNFANCADLAYLYIVRSFYQPNETDDVERELSDITPSYTIYRNIKRNYQLGVTNADEVLLAMSQVCREIYEFIMTIYSSTNTAEERKLLSRAINKACQEMR